MRYAITKKRLLAGLGSSGSRQLLFFIAEEGITAAAYVVASVEGSLWTIEECGDRDPSGARVGAILQGLLAREPTERAKVVMVRSLGSTATDLRLTADDVLLWHGDVD